MRVPPRAWPLLLAAAALGGAGGCSLPSLDDLTPDFSWRAIRGLANPVVGAEEPRPPLAGTRALRVAVGRTGPRGYATLLQETGERRLWRSADPAFALSTEGPRVVATSGLGTALLASRADGPDPLLAPDAVAALLADGREVPSRRLVDLGTADRDPAGMRFGLALDCRLSAAPDADGDAALLRVEEDCRGPRPVGAFTNRFTLRRATGEVVRSEQWVGPGLPLLRVEPFGAGRRRTAAPATAAAVAAPPDGGAPGADPPPEPAAPVAAPTAAPAAPWWRPSLSLPLPPGLPAIAADESGGPPVPGAPAR